MYDRIDPQKQERERLEQLQREQRRISNDVHQQTRYPSREAREIEDLKYRLLELNQTVQYLTQELLEWNTDPEAKRDQLFDKSVKQAAQSEVKRIMAPHRAELEQKVQQLEDANRKIQALQTQIDAQVVEAQRLKKTITVTDSKTQEATSDKNHVLRVNEGLREQIKTLKAELAPYKTKEVSQQAAQVEQERIEQVARAEQESLEQEEAQQQLEVAQFAFETQQKQAVIDAATPNLERIKHVLSDENKDREGKTKSMSQRTSEAADVLKRYPQEKRIEFFESFMQEQPEEAYLMFQKADLSTHKRFVELGPMFSQARGLDKLENTGVKKPEPQKPVDAEHAKTIQQQGQLEQQYKATHNEADIERHAWEIIEAFRGGGGIGQHLVKELPQKLRVPVFQFVKEKMPKVWDMHLERFFGNELKDNSQQTAPQTAQEPAFESIEAPQNELEPQNFSNPASGQLEPRMEQQQGQRVNERLEPSAQNLTSSKEKSGFIDRSDGAFIRSSPEVNGIIKGKLESADQVSILGQYRRNGGWVYVQGITKGSVVSGWMAKDRLETQKPEPRAKLHHVKSGETPEGLARANFRDAAQPGMDYRFYVNALIYVNEQDKRDGIQAPLLPFTAPQLEAGKRIWLLSPEFAMSLKGVVGSGSITGGAFAKAREQSTVLPDTLESVALALQLGDDVMQKDIWNALCEHWLEILGMTTLFVGAEVATIALTAAPEPALTKVAAAAILQSILAGFAVYGTVEASKAALSEGQQWLETASNAKGNPKEIKKAAIHLVRMLENVGMALLATVQGTGNVGKTLEVSKNFKLPRMPGMQPQAVTPEGVQLNVPEQQPQLENASQTSRTGRLEILPATTLRINSHRGVLERIFPREAIAKAPAEIKAKALKIREGAEDIIDAAEKAAKKNPKGQDAILEKLDKDLRNYFEKVDTDNGRIRLNNNEVIFRDRSSAVAEAKNRAGIPESAKPVDTWEVGGDSKLAELSKANAANAQRFDSGKPVPDYVQKPDQGAWGRYEVYEVRVNGRPTRHAIVDHTDDPNNFLRHVHAVEYNGNPSGNTIRKANYKPIDSEHHLAYQEAK
jgi:hypothetical protein